MHFCKKCGNLLTVIKKRTRSYLYCKRCKKEFLLKEKIKISQPIIEKRQPIIIMRKGEGIEGFPRTKVICPKCEHTEAYWWMQQTRAGDEPPTLFYRCVKCGYSWRSYG